jgi:queuine/archaeosine tRNA-ribosyltransferase
MLGPRLVSLHNLHFYGALMGKAREMIRVGELRRWVEATLEQMQELDEIGETEID